MKCSTLFALVITASGFAVAETPDPVNGKKLFNESRCLTCHGTDVFTRKNRLVKNLPELEKQVRQCDARLSANWFDDQILDVVSYLNKDYYQFDKHTNTPPPK